MIERAFVILDSLETFNPAFPLLIIGCEARTDEKRMKILGYIKRAMKTSCLSSLNGLQNIIQQLWVQDDLTIGYELNYLERLDAVMISCRNMPNFVWYKMYFLRLEYDK